MTGRPSQAEALLGDKQLFDLLSATSREQLLDVFLQTLEPFGVCGGLLVNQTGAQASAQNRTETRAHSFTYLNRYSDAFFNDYLSVGGGHSDPCVYIADEQSQLLSAENETATPCVAWDQIDHLLSSRPHLAKPGFSQMEELSQDHQLNLGFSFCQRNLNGFEGLGLGLEMSYRQFEAYVRPNQQRLIQAVSLYLAANRRLCRTYSDNQSDQQSVIALTNREYALLSYLTEGKRLQEIADVFLMCSVHTLNKDLKSLRQRTGAATTEQLVVYFVTQQMG